MDATNWTNCVGSVVLFVVNESRNITKLLTLHPELESVFNIGTLDGKNNLHPVNFCTKCYYKIDNFKGQQVKSPFQTLVWVPHDMKGCGTCKLASTNL